MIKENKQVLVIGHDSILKQQRIIRLALKIRPPMIVFDDIQKNIEEYSPEQQLVMDEFCECLNNLGFKNPEKMERFLSENSTSSQKGFFENKWITIPKSVLSSEKVVVGIDLSEGVYKSSEEVLRGSNDK